MNILLRQLVLGSHARLIFDKGNRVLVVFSLNRKGHRHHRERDVATHIQPHVVTAGARPGKINMMSLPNSANSRLLPDRKPSPTPTSSSKDPTPQAMPNMVRNERSLCAHRLRKIWVKMSETVRMIERYCTFQHWPHSCRNVTLEIRENAVQLSKSG